jgi:ribosomal protein S18 acetylase RimI-like enzyme
MQSGFQIREATQKDVSKLAALHVEAFNETHGAFNSPNPGLREEQWSRFFRDQDENSFCFLIEKDDGELAGFAKGIRYKEDLPGYEGELNKIYVLKKYHRYGFGRGLICKVAEKFIQQNISSMLLFGDAKSQSNGFYERLGAKKLFAANGEFHGGYGWGELTELARFCSGFPSE